MEFSTLPFPSYDRAHEERFGAQCRVDFFMAHIFVPMIVANALAAGCRQGLQLPNDRPATLRPWSLTLLTRSSRLVRSTLTTKAALFCLPTARSLSQWPSSWRKLAARLRSFKERQLGI